MISILNSSVIESDVLWSINRCLCQTVSETKTSLRAKNIVLCFTTNNHVSSCGGGEQNDLWPMMIFIDEKNFEALRNERANELMSVKLQLDCCHFQFVSVLFRSYCNEVWSVRRERWTINQSIDLVITWANLQFSRLGLVSCTETDYNLIFQKWRVETAPAEI